MTEDTAEYQIPNQPRHQLGTERTESVASLQKHIQDGGRLILLGQYAQAIQHFQQKDKAQEVGLGFSSGISLLEDSIQRADIESLANRIARKSWYWRDSKRISPASLSVAGRRIGEIKNPRPGSSLARVQHEVALIHMEEWEHALRDLDPSHAIHTDPEVDVAAHMQRYQVPMTPAFLKRYDRGHTLGIEFEDTDDSLSQTPSLRKGIFVHVRRGDGSIESDWQIIKFDTKTGEPIAANFRLGLQRTLRHDEFYETNQQGSYPFRDIMAFPQLFDLIHSLGKIQGTESVYTSSKLNRMINLVREGKENIDTIPRSGGLRLKVAELLNIRTSTTGMHPTRLLNRRQ